MEAVVGRPELWQLVRSIAVGISKSTALLFVKDARCIENSDECRFKESRCSWLKELCDSTDLVGAHVNQVGKNRTCFALSLRGEATSSSETVSCSTSSLSIL
jgi:hypothetical protein